MHIQTFRGGLDLLALHQRNPARYPFLLESVSVSPSARYSLLFAFPQQCIRLDSLDESGFCTRLDAAWATSAVKSGLSADSLPFRGGWFLYLGYELAGQLEPSLTLPATPLPVALAVRIPAAVVVNHHDNQTIVLSEQAFGAEFAAIVADCQLPAVSAALPELLQGVVLQEDNPEQFLAGVARIRDYIAAGDVFQVNLSRGWQGCLPEPYRAADVYRALRKANPAPFAALADFGAFTLVSSSPERLVRVKAGRVETRPIAGTRPRSDDPQRDQAWLEELMAHPKERAEHIMLIDLERNDLGRICHYGTVRVDELMTVESYRHVHHIVSNISGRLREGVTPGQVIRATFPGGTITGCPKVRCMEIIAELEQTGRGAYTGSVGYLNHDGSMDLNILIRTLTLTGRQLAFRTGAGIVIDSVPMHELRETRHKARGLLRALSHDTG